MKYLVQNPDKQTVKENTSIYNVTPRYIEVITAVGKLQYVYYIVFRDAESVTFAACLDDLFVGKIKIDEDIVSMGQLSAIAAALMKNTLAGDYLHGALIHSQDPDDQKMKSFIVTILENLEIESPQDFFERQVLRPSTVLLSGVEMLSEITNRGNIPVDAGSILRSFAHGATLGLFFKPNAVNLERTFLNLFTTEKKVSAPLDPRRAMDKAALERYVERINKQNRL